MYLNRVDCLSGHFRLVWHRFSSKYILVCIASISMAGRPAAATFIVPQNTVLTVQAMGLEKLGPVQLRVMLADGVRPKIDWLARRGLLHNTHTCVQCQVPCNLVVQRGAQDGYRWRCRRCNGQTGLRKGSFFKSKIELGKLVWILFSWAAGVPSHHVAWHLGVSPRTMVDWNNFVRDVCTEDTRRHLAQVGGLGGFDNAGQPIVVEIDESYFYGRKYHRGRIVHGLWVFGAVERESGRCMLQVVRNRRAQTLLPLIQQWCLPGTHVMSDGWAAYQNLAQFNGGVYLHDVIVYQHNFVDPLHPDVHTQNIENLWMRAKRKLRRQFGTTRPLFDTYLEEFMWMERHK